MNPATRPKRILIIDDAATTRSYHRRILADSGFAMDDAVDGMEALEMATQQEYDLFLVDVLMPKMDGYAFLAAMRARRSAPQPPALVITNLSASRYAGEAYRSGANFFMSKPAHPGDLLTAATLLIGD